MEFCGCLLFWETHTQHFLVLILRVCVDSTCSHIYFAKILLVIQWGWLSYTGLTFQYCGLRSYCWGRKVCQNGVVAIMQNNPDAVVAGLIGICVDLNKHASHSNSIDASSLVISSTCKLYFSPMSSWLVDVCGLKSLEEASTISVAVKSPGWAHVWDLWKCKHLDCLILFYCS